MSTESAHGVTTQDLYAYFDDELPADEAAVVARAIETEPALKTELEQIGVVRGTVRASLTAEAEAMPAARFEQIWDEIDRAIERDQRLQAEADRNASIWTRLLAALRPVRVPALAAAGAAAATVLVLNLGGEETNKAPDVASVHEPSPQSPPSEADPAPGPRLADAKATVTPPPTAEPKSENPKVLPMPVPESSEAEIHGIEFGVGGGRIAQTGTVTVLYVEEDEEPNSERSL